MCIIFPIIILLLSATIYISYYFTRRLGKPLEERVEYVGISDKGAVVLEEKMTDSEIEKNEIIRIKAIFDDKFNSRTQFQQKVEIEFFCE